MTRYLLDTDTLVDFSKGHDPVRSTILQMINAGDILGVCAINVAEFLSGVPKERESIWQDFFASLTYWNITRKAAGRAGRSQYDAARSGKTLATADALIAAVAREQDATILTSNLKDFVTYDVNVMSLRSEST
jgi:predicted nucleic acid-binding protein